MFNQNRKFNLFCLTIVVFHLESTRELEPESSLLPVSFQPPVLGASDHWQERVHTRERGNRRFFFEASEDGFHQLMSELFGTRDAVEPLRHPWPQRNLHVLERHLRPDPIERVPLSPPATAYIRKKPIRASVIKLEPVNRFTAPVQSHRDHFATPRHPSNFGSIPKQVLIENSKHEKLESLHPTPSFPLLPTGLHVLPKTGELNHEINFNGRDREIPRVKFHYEAKNAETNEISARKRRPPQQESGPQTTLRTIPYVIFSPGMASTSSDQKTVAFSTNVPLNLYKKGIYDDVSHSQWTNFGSSRFSQMNHSSEEWAGKVMKNNRNEMGNGASVERIANLTAEGISRNLGTILNSQNYVNHVDVKNLVNYERRKFSNDTLEIERFFLPRRELNFNDEHNLDARILKDTNWDGLTRSPLEAAPEVNASRTGEFSTRFDQNLGIVKPGGDKAGEARHTTVPSSHMESTVSGEKEKIQLQAVVVNINTNSQPAEEETLNPSIAPLSPEDADDMNYSITTPIPKNSSFTFGEPMENATQANTAKTEATIATSSSTPMELLVVDTSATDKPETATQTTQETRKPASFRRKFKKRPKTNFSTSQSMKITNEIKQHKAETSEKSRKPEDDSVKDKSTAPLSGTSAKEIITSSEESGKRRKKLSSRRVYRKLKRTSSTEGTVVVLPRKSHRNRNYDTFSEAL